MIRLPVAKQRLAARVEPTRAERHYLLEVLRLRPGARLEVFDGEGGLYPATLDADGRLELGERRLATRTRPVTLAQALAKGEKMDWVVQKATELGAAAILPFTSARTVVRLEGDRAAERVGRWRRIAEQAARQCGRADVPRLLPVATFEQALALLSAEGATCLLLHEKERSLRLSEALAAADGPVAIFAGPEGGFAEAEVALALERGARTVGLGSIVLRTETVCLAALAVVRFLDGELG